MVGRVFFSPTSISKLILLKDTRLHFDEKSRISIEHESDNSSLLKSS
jgi:hypothetical protein